ncbi:MAG: hypothetical protein A3H98_01035 [Bacteroidetes bacterium RIFCSPLOWO2_02_FULL_36_8]|nr:MAG: hypothetical protein A3H98_01035 [Bacteroidetes bacterium RIFCSPLOWO2_02_FULL_36_8]OFY71013.1 MAG: hypothetical protein A3G23_12935 [Bacteroidetes bacterium RIFCSPLOWO2_12_FULL_37_12]
MEIGLLISGLLGFEVIQKLLNHFNINFVLTDKQSVEIVRLCNEKKIACYAGNPRNGLALKKLPKINCDVIVSVNYLFLIEKDIIELPKKIAINFHGSLLPKYRGRTPHVWAIINNESETGVTAHVIDEECDSGAILAQKKIPISSEDSGGTLLEMFKKIYPDFVIEVLQNIRNNSYTAKPQNNLLATYFGKRTAGDGRIDWNWQKERIYNWVRAQAKPYPGAFTFYRGNKIIIHKIKFSEFGFHCTIPNGTILEINNKIPIVKTPNGCIEIIDFETDCTMDVNNNLQ